MSAPRFFTDEDVYRGVAVALRRAQLDALSTPEATRFGQSDSDQLEWASSAGRVLMTFNVAHFAMLHSEWMASGKHHTGPVVSNQRPMGDVVRRLIHLAASLSAEDLRDRLEFLGDW